MRIKKPPKNTDSVRFRRYMAKKLDGYSLKCVAERKNEEDTVIAKTGFICVRGDELEVVAFGVEDVLFRAKIDTLSAWEFLSLNGAVLTGYDLDRNEVRTVIVYYTYYRK